MNRLKNLVLMLLMLGSAISVVAQNKTKLAPTGGIVSMPVRKLLASALEMRNGVAYAPVKQGKEIVGMEPFTGIALEMYIQHIRIVRVHVHPLDVVVGYRRGSAVVVIHFLTGNGGGRLFNFIQL